MAFNDSAVTRSSSSILETNKVLKNTYSLLSMTLVFSGIMAAISMVVNPPYIVSMISSIGALVLIWFVIPRTANSSMGIFVVFLFTGLLGFGLGPILNQYMALENGARIISLSLAGTGIIFLGLSGYALTTKKDFSFLGGFLVAGMIMVIIAAIANIFLGFSGLSLAISSIVIMIMSGFILYDTSRIINGGETNYIMATVGLYLSIYNIFVSLLHLLGALGGDD
ncbi:MAG: Bax inhibitor-1/YccA family protein [Gammaproteobacteria bacterium]